jgi:hypothetical protein
MLRNIAAFGGRATRQRRIVLCSAVCVLHVPQAGGWKARKIVNPGSAEWPEVVDERE